MKWSPKMKCCDVRTNSLKQYHKECMKNSVEKMHVDVGVWRVKVHLPNGQGSMQVNFEQNRWLRRAKSGPGWVRKIGKLLTQRTSWNSIFFNPDTETSFWLVTQTSQRECRRDCMTSKRRLVVDYDSAPLPHPRAPHGLGGGDVWHFRLVVDESQNNFKDHDLDHLNRTNIACLGEIKRHYFALSANKPLMLSKPSQKSPTLNLSTTTPFLQLTTSAISEPENHRTKTEMNKTRHKQAIYSSRPSYY